MSKKKDKLDKNHKKGNIQDLSFPRNDCESPFDRVVENRKNLNHFFVGSVGTSSTAMCSSITRDDSTFGWTNFKDFRQCEKCLRLYNEYYKK